MAVNKIFHSIFQYQTESSGLLGIYDLFDIAQINVLMSEKKSVFSMYFYFQAFRFAGATSMTANTGRFFGQYPMILWHGKCRHFLLIQRIFSTKCTDFCGNVHRMIRIHLDNRIGNVEKCTGASGYQNCGNPGFFIEISGTFQKRSDRFFFTGDDFLHEGVPHHKIGRGGIFIQQKNFASGFDSFHNTCGL